MYNADLFLGEIYINVRLGIVQVKWVFSFVIICGPKTDIVQVKRR